MAEIDAAEGGIERWQFGPFTLDLAKRELARDGTPVSLNARYLDALALLVRADGAVVAKDTFIETAWHGVPVTDEALTQAVRSLRKALGDDAAAPRYIATVPKHGYRFIGELVDPDGDSSSQVSANTGWSPLTAGLAGSALAGMIVGTTYGTFVPATDGGSVLSGLLVVTLVAVGAALLAGAGVAGGIMLARRWFPTARWRDVVGGLTGGLLTGAIGRMLALDGFGLILGAAPISMTGALEGGAIGMLVGLSVSFSRFGWKACAAAGAALGGLAGGALSLVGGRFLGASLADLGSRYSGSRLDMDAIGAIFAEDGFGPTTLAVTGTFEAAIFCACMAGALALFTRPARH